MLLISLRCLTVKAEDRQDQAVQTEDLRAVEKG